MAAPSQPPIIISEYRDGWRRAIETYNISSEAKRFVDAFQKNGECCGIDNATDWVTYNSALFVADSNRLPSSCRCTSDDNCTTVNMKYNGINYPQFAFNRGCYDITVAFYQLGSLVVAIVAIIFAIIELFGVVVALGLICCITSAKRKQVV